MDTKINIRESLNKYDLRNNNKYDLRNLYDSCIMDDKEKRTIAEMIYNKVRADVLYEALMNKFEGKSLTEDRDLSDVDTYEEAEEPFSYEEALSLFKRFGFTNGEVLELIYDLLEEEKYIAFHHGGQPYYTWKEINKIQDQADDYLSELRNESLKESKSLNESSTDSYLNALLIDKFDELHGSDYNWNRHNCDYTAFYNELREVAGADESDFGREIGPYEMFKRLPLEKKLDFMNRFDRTTKRD